MLFITHHGETIISRKNNCFSMKNTKPHQFLTSIDQSKYHHNKQCCSSHVMVEPSFREKTAVFGEKYQTSPIPNIIDQSKYHHNK